MKTKLLSALLIASALVAAPVLAADAYGNNSPEWVGCYRGARNPDLVKNFNDINVATSSGKPLQAEQVKQAIVQAGKAKGWTVSTLSDNRLLATINVRGKHTVSVEIPYSSNKYSLLYKDSTNLHHAVCEGHAYIHPSYNKWVNTLQREIQSKLMDL